MKQIKATNFVLPQWLAGIGATLLLTHIGLMGGWASPTLARLAAPNSPIPVDDNQASYVASLVNFTRFFGGIIGPLSVAYLGSKRSVIVTLLPIAIGWLLVVLASSVEYLYASRLFSGVGLGMVFSVFPLYLGEVAMPEIRGALISLATLGASAGQVVASIFGSYLDMSLASGIYLALALLLMLAFHFVPESPHFLIKTGQHEAARASVAWYRAGKGVDEELVAVEAFVSDNQKLSDKLKSIASAPMRRAVLQIVVLFAAMQLSGLNIIMFFMEYILKRARFSLMEPSLVVICVNVGCMLATIGSIFLIDRCGRKCLLLVSSTGTTLAMLGLTCHFLLLGAGSTTADSPIVMQWLPAFCMLLFMFSFFLGLMPGPNAILSESFPANVKCIVACIAILTGAITSFLSAKTFQPLLDLVGDAYVFMIYAVLSALIIPYTLFAVTETKGKSLQQIQDEFNKK